VTKALDGLPTRRSRQQVEVAAWCWVGAAQETAMRWLDSSPRKRPSAAKMAQWLAEFNLRGVGVTETRQT
jgi:hypothetical protein